MSDFEFGVRQATEHDLDALTTLFVEANHFHQRGEPDVFACIEDCPYAAERMLASITGDETAILAAECDGQVVGFVQVMAAYSHDIPVMIQRRFAVIENLIVSEPFRGRGIGGALMRAAHDGALGRGFHEIELTVWEFNDTARELYERLGYETASRRMRMGLRQE